LPQTVNAPNLTTRCYTREQGEGDDLGLLRRFNKWLLQGLKPSVRQRRVWIPCRQRKQHRQKRQQKQW